MNGQVTLDGVMNNVKPTTVLISVMLANNETGILQVKREREKDEYITVL